MVILRFLEISLYWRELAALMEINIDNHNPFLEADKQEILEIYKSCFPIIRNMILQYSGTEEQARDIFQDALLVLFQNSHKQGFLLTAAPSTYLYSVAKNKWWKELKRTGRMVPANENENTAEIISFDDDIAKQRERLLAKCLSQLGKNCQSLLKLFFENVEPKIIMTQLGFGKYDYYRVAKTRCVQKLKTIMQQDKLFNELKN